MSNSADTPEARWEAASERYWKADAANEAAEAVEMAQAGDALRDEVERLRAQLAEAQECLSGVVWLLEQGALVRDIRDDAQSDYPARSMRFVAFLARMVRAAGLRTAEGEGHA